MNNDIKLHLSTLRDWLRYSVSQFQLAELSFGHGSDNAYDEAVYLLLHTLHLPLDRLEPFLDAKLLPFEMDLLEQKIKARVVKRLPMAYITQEAWLGDWRFYVDERVIVPRSFISELLREGLEPWLSQQPIYSALDLCTGSGCLAIMIAHAFPEAMVDAVDLSSDALAVAQHNVAEYGLDEQIQLIRSDFFQNLKDKKYDLIISNPPYVDAPSVAALPKEYLHEPTMALGSGEDGLDATRIILANAKHHLNDGGVLIVEIGHNRDILEDAFPNLPFVWLDVAAGDQFVFLLHKEDLPD